MVVQFKYTSENGEKPANKGPVLVIMVVCYTVYRWPARGRVTVDNNPEYPAPYLRNGKGMLRKYKEEIENGRSAIRSAAILSALALVIAYIALIVALENGNG